MRYAEQMAEQVDIVFRARRELRDHRPEHRWLTGWLGDPSAPAWFLSEAPSAWRVDQADATDQPHSSEDQWALSRGDKAFRQALRKSGLKEGDRLSPGGSRCYVTCLSKSPVDYGSGWREKPDAEKFRLFEMWAPVLAWELNRRKAKVVAAMGEVTMKGLRHLVALGLVQLPSEPVLIWSYGYLMQPDRTGRSPAERIREYENQVAAVGRAAILASATTRA